MPSARIRRARCGSGSFSVALQSHSDRRNWPIQHALWSIQDMAGLSSRLRQRGCMGVSILGGVLVYWGSRMPKAIP